QGGNIEPRRKQGDNCLMDLCYPSDNYHPAYVVVQYCLLAIALLAVCMLLVGDGFGYKLFVLSAD
uniref:hypothetical protein n=1 Tax=Phocaeicola vulgatus TaxID=821 RepID=UPI003FEF358D